MLENLFEARKDWLLPPNCKSRKVWMGTKLPLLQKPRRRLGWLPPETVIAATGAPTEDPDDPSAVPPDPELSKTPNAELPKTPELPEIQSEDT